MASLPDTPYFFADLYSFKWSKFNFRLPLISGAAVALCLFAGIFAGHPGAGLIAGGGALTVGFGANQRIIDSRLIPMIAAIFATSSAAMVGTLAGPHGYLLVFVAAIAGAIYGFLTTRHVGVSWVGQQATIALLVASAFPMGLEAALIRAGLLAAGGAVQLVVTSVGLRMVPNLRADLVWFAEFLGKRGRESDWRLLNELRIKALCLTCLSRSETAIYAARLFVTMLIATEIYHRSGIQSGYWIPMTALLVQKPAFAETFTRAAGRIFGTLAGAWICSLLLAELAPSPPVLAALTAIFAVLAFATNSVNYGLFSVCITGYIVFLLSLNQIPGPVIAHRRALCTIAGGLIALAIHADALIRKQREAETQS